MNLLEKKATIVQAILNDADEYMLAEIEFILQPQNRQKYPCQYTTEEVKESVQLQLNAYRSGKLKTVPHEEVVKLHV
jgi:hypothetical protein